MARERVCDECGAAMTWKMHKHTVEVGAVKVNDETTFAFVCGGCGDVQISLAQLAGYERRAARTVLTDRPNAGGAVYKYARKALGLKQTELALLMGCTAEAISRWENDQSPMPKAEQLALSGLLNGVEVGTTDLAAAMEAARASHPPTPPELEVKAVTRKTG